MKIQPDTPLTIALRWDEGDIQTVGHLAYRDGLSCLEYSPEFLPGGIQLSPLHHRTEAGLQTPYDRHVFKGLHGVFQDSLPDGWGRARKP